MKFDTKKDIALHNDWVNLFSGALMDLLAKAKAVVRQYCELYLLQQAIQSERRVLAALSERELKDVGIDRDEAIIESRRRYKDVPDSRLK